MADIAIGTYEGHVLYYRLSLQESDTNNNLSEIRTLPLIFTDNGHVGNVKHLAHGIKYLSSGSSDETIRLFDVKKRKEIGSLLHPNVITGMEFYKSSHLITCSKNGEIFVWQTKTWDQIKIFKKLRSPVVAISLHPTGSVLLSSHEDRSLRLWDMVQGRLVSHTLMPKLVEKISWSPSGYHFLTISEKLVSVFKLPSFETSHSASKSSMILQREFSKDVLCARFLTDDLLVLGGEFGQITILRLSDDIIVCEIPIDSPRTKDIQVLSMNETSIGYHVGKINRFKPSFLIISISSNSVFRVWILTEYMVDLWMERCFADGYTLDSPKLLVEQNVIGRPTSLSCENSPHFD